MIGLFKSGYVGLERIQNEHFLVFEEILGLALWVGGSCRQQKTDEEDQNNETTKRIFSVSATG
ncbi:conserved hypothetical protein [delta proteobacterium NaphS2]|nr:conserved hypothetical protein [delta proteobacterium NaphS2]